MDPTGPPDGWNEMESELLAMVDRTIADFKGDAKRVYLTGLSYGGFGAWNLAARHPQKFAALAPIVGYGHPDHAEPIARAKLPLVGVRRRTRSGRAAALLLSGAQQARSARAIPKCASPSRKTWVT